MAEQKEEAVKDEKHAVVMHSAGPDWVAEVLPSKAEAESWAEVFRENASEGVTYTVHRLEDVVKQ